MTYNGRLTSLSHGGGCGCKIAPGVLSDILKSSPIRQIPAALLAGSDNNEDAAVYQLNENQAIVATTDFFMPIVDDPYQFGRIAATNAISDIYAMGAQPLFALALLGMPINVLPLEVIQQITAGGESVCAEAGIMIAGGHSIDTVEPIYGLVAIGVVDPKKLKRNSGAKLGDSIILSKPLGVGILSAALKKEQLSDSAYKEMIALTTKLNKPGVVLSQLDSVHALTDVTGFGLAGHLLELSRGAKLSAQIQWSSIPVIAEAVKLVKEGTFTGASPRNWLGYGHEISMAPHLSEWQQNLLSDPQTSGGLLISCSPEATEQVLDILRTDGFNQAQKIGQFVQGSGLLVA
ncbi:selenide, water dikinase SelD [Polynucleobacter sphagniphilus]|jgi:selenide,water dikinase|uniref:selenide, water dikinase SelD n=1 Tax=Polynucleobacter sphagniphilus TaxID=1743169 RepID=UPI00096BC9B9|nr:selenide, water dikinase SelD [Polynucleobacter sphagniphilus]MDH6154477.1 selenide,water dikinase [Polynucleobacter sphagniphilus]MDH6241548.1 selenide,water dikinase [Polynucleobacter sphagniphilus]OLY96171.1 selenide, water dikinase SelD [Polynucleobacter sphagniphilus]